MNVKGKLWYRWIRSAMSAAAWAACGLAVAAGGPEQGTQTVWLDELDISQATAGWGEPRRNQSVEGKPMAIAGRKFDRGLGTHSPGVFRVRLDGGATRFTAAVGVDDEVAKRPSQASAEFQVVGDGKVLWSSGVMRCKEPAKQVDVDLAGVKLLELVVTDGGDGYACDHADWADAKFEVAAGRKIAAVAASKKPGKGPADSKGGTKTPAGKHQPDPKVTGRIDLGSLAGSGVRVAEGFAGAPDDSPWGVLGTYELALPAFTAGVLYAHANPNAAGWPNMMNRAFPYPFTNAPEAIARLNDGGVFLLLSLADGSHLAVAALAGAKTQSWFHTDQAGRMLLSFGTFGTAEARCDAPLMAWARSEDAYAACHAAYAAALDSPALAGQARLRHQKAYPEYLEYLGWCSWEHFHGRITEQSLLEAIDGIEASGLPIRYVLVDDGHTSAKRGAMDSFRPNPTKFPNEWAPLLKRRHPDRIRWMALWHDFKGYSNGVATDNDLGEAINRHLEKLTDTSLTVRNDPNSSLAFYRAFMGSVKQYGFDFVKTDFQSAQLARLAGKVDNAVQRCARNSQAFEAALHELGLGLINCNWHNPANFLNCLHSSVGRCSIDYSKNSAPSAKRHIYQSYANIVWLGQLAWGDHDMFHSSHQGVGRIMAVSKAVSGGPVYLSDDPKDFVAEYITPLCLADGRLLRPLAPAAPLPDSLFVDPAREDKPYRVVAPLSGRCAAVVACNLAGAKDEVVLKAAVTADDYARAGVMVQPYTGRWELPAEGLVVYDRDAGTGGLLDKEYAFELKGFADRLVLLCPVRHGWAAVGRTDKYLCPAAVEVAAASKDQLELRLVESGPLAVWSAAGQPRAEGLTFVAAGGGLYRADMPVGRRDLTITIRR